jgi:hypothetical protein
VTSYEASTLRAPQCPPLCAARTLYPGPNAMKTNAARILDKLAVPYELRTYEVDPEDLSAETVAAKIGFPLEQVWKTLVCRGDRNGVCLSRHRWKRPT